MNTHKSPDIDLSIIIVSYNTAKLTVDCLNSLVFFLKKEKKIKTEIIVVDNASSDESVEMLTAFQKLQVTSNKIQVRTVKNTKNVGFGIANNQGVEKAHGKYILLLNSDTLIEEIDFNDLLKYMDINNDIGILSVKVKFPHGPIDPASHRGFPTIWRSFCYFSGLENITKTTPFAKLFGGYHLTHLDLNNTHEIDCPAGAFFLMPRKIYKEVGGFDEQFFMYGEDIDLAYRIKEKGYRVVYYPQYTILHLKHQSGLKSTPETKAITKRHFYNAMKMFYKKHYAKKHTEICNKLIYFAIDLKAKF